MHLTIAICDDNPDDSAVLNDLVLDFCSDRQLDVRIDLYSSGEELLAACLTVPYSILFMDIYMAGINGIDTIRQLDSRSSSVIFTSTSREHAIEAFGVNATHYLLKPLTASGIQEAMTRCLHTLGGLSDKQIRVKCSQGDLSIPMNGILYIEVFNKVSVIHTRTRTFQTYMTLNALYELLDESFMKAQRSFVVNMYTIESFSFDHITLKDGKEIVLSRQNRQTLKKQYQDFLFQAARKGTI